MIENFYWVFWENSIFLDYLYVFFLFFQVDKVIAGIFGSEGSKSYRKEVLINTIKYSFI